MKIYMKKSYRGNETKGEEKTKEREMNKNDKERKK